MAALAATPEAPVTTPTPTPAPAPVAATPTPTPAPPPVYPIAQPPPSSPGKVEISVEVLQNLTAANAELAQIREARQREANERATREAEMVAEAGELKRGLTTLREQKEKELADERKKLQEYEDRIQHTVVQRDVLGVVATKNVVPEAVEQLVQLLMPQFKAVQEGGVYKTKTPLHEDVGPAIDKILAMPSYQHFLKAAHQGGVGQHGGANQPSTPPATIVQAADQMTAEQWNSLTYAEKALMASKYKTETMEEEASKGKSPMLNPLLGVGGFRGKAANHA